MNNNIPSRDIRKKYIKNNNPEVVDKYIRNLERLSKENPDYKLVYQQDLDYYNYIKLGGFLSSKRSGSDCHAIREGSRTCNNRAMNLLEINDKINKYIREGKIPLRQAQNVVKDFLDTCLCCDSLYRQKIPENTIVNLMSKIVKKITNSVPLLEFAYKYVLPIYFSDGDRIFDTQLYKDTELYIKNPNDPINRKRLKERIKNNSGDYKTITTGIITAIFMAVEKKFN